MSLASSGLLCPKLSVKEAQFLGMSCTKADSSTNHTSPFPEMGERPSLRYKSESILPCLPGDVKLVSPSVDFMVLGS